MRPDDLFCPGRKDLNFFRSNFLPRPRQKIASNKREVKQTTEQTVSNHMMKCTILRKVRLCEMYHMVLTGEASGTLEEMRKLATVYGDGGSYDKASCTA